MLARNKASIDGQTCSSWEQIFLCDMVGTGVAEANRKLAANEYAMRGKYVMILDDDDLLLQDNAISKLCDIAIDGPDVIVFKADHDELGILPARDVWEAEPLLGCIGSIDFITRRDVWNRHVHEFDKYRCGDFWFLRSIWDSDPNVVWFDDVLAGVQRISRGEAE